MRPFKGKAFGAGWFDSEADPTWTSLDGREQLLVVTLHDTTDDFMLSVSSDSQGVDFEMDSQTAVRLAAWILDNVEYRHSPEGQKEQADVLARSQEHAAK